MALALSGVGGWGELSPELGTLPMEWVPLFRLAGLEEAGPGDLCVLPAQASPLQVRACRAQVLVGSSRQREHLMSDFVPRFVEVPEPSRVFLDILEGPCRPPEAPEDWLSPLELAHRFGERARHAMVHRTAELGHGVALGAGAVIHPRVRLGEGVCIGDGTVVGAPGFGLVLLDGVRRPLPHWGGVEVGAGSRIGAQCQIAAGLLDPTRIGRDCHLDAQIQVGHNCRIGDGSVLASQAGLAGSVILGDRCLVGGQAGFADHVRLGDDCVVAARAGVTRSWPVGTVLRGF
ncbi:MAG TPA: DapH/DapD/GlmU-related protein, partial [Fibrobacteria bacterium]|nr:DapH/DapD/GlmU-related protein [Fibrobacteria bacterium]